MSPHAGLTARHRNIGRRRTRHVGRAAPQAEVARVFAIGCVLAVGWILVAGWILAAGAWANAADESAEQGGQAPPLSATPQTLLELYNVDASQLRQLVDDVPLGLDDEETVTRILAQMPRFPLDLLERWASEQQDRGDWLEHPAAHRGDALHVAGRARFVERHELPIEAAERFDFDHYYVVAVEPAPETTSPAAVADSDTESVSEPTAQRWLVCTREVPRAWPTDEPIDEPAAAFGLFLKTGATHGRVTDVVLAAPRVAWFPDHVDPARGVTDDHVQLAALGMDVGLLDQVRSLHRKPILGADRECFYQLLAAVSRATPEQLAGPECRGFAFAPLLQAPVEQQGECFTVVGTARRITKIFIGERDLRERFGIDHYFQIDVSVPLDRLSIRLGESTEEEGPVFNNTYPTTICVLRLPPGLREGDDLRQDVRINAVYFKLWAYRSEYMASFDDRQLQMGPLLIGLAPSLVQRPAPPYSQLGVIAGAVALLALGGAWFGLWRAGRSDARFEKTIVRRQFAPREGESLNDAGIEPRSGPDFSKLD